jgi:Tfp pilus assembly protein FimT
MTVVVLVGIVSALAVPAWNRVLADMRRRSATNLVVNDIFYTRMLAVRSGRSAVMRFDGGGRCPMGAGARVVSEGYRVVISGPVEHEVKAVSLRATLGKVCLQTNNSDSIAFDSRGLLIPFANRTLWLDGGTGVNDTVSISVVGRVLRR